MWTRWEDSNQVGRNDVSFENLGEMLDGLRSRVYFLMELVSGGELLDALDSIGLLKYSQAG